MKDETQHENSAENTASPQNNQTPSEQLADTTLKPRFDVDSLYPQPTVGILAKPEQPSVINSAQNKIEPAPVDNKQSIIGTVVVIIGLLVILSSLLSLWQSVPSIIASGGRVSLLGGMSVIMSIVFVVMGIGLIKKSEASRLWYVIFSSIGVLIIVGSLAYVASLYNDPRYASILKPDPEQSKIDKQRQILSEQSRIDGYNSRMAQDQERISLLEKDGSGDLSGNIASAKNDIEKTKLDIQESQLRIKQIEQGAVNSSTQGFNMASFMSYQIAVNVFSIVLYIGSIVFLTRKRVKAIFHN